MGRTVACAGHGRALIMGPTLSHLVVSFAQHSRRIVKTAKLRAIGPCRVRRNFVHSGNVVAISLPGFKRGLAMRIGHLSNWLQSNVLFSLTLGTLVAGSLVAAAPV